MTEQEERDLVVAEARSWIDTPYHNCADVKGAGVDCGMIIVRVFVDTGLVAPFDPRPYAQDWHLHRDDERYLGWVRTWCEPVEEPRPGDLVVFRYGRAYSHGGIVVSTDPVAIVHAYLDEGRVLEERIDRNARLSSMDRQRLFFSYWAKKQ